MVLCTLITDTDVLVLPDSFIYVLEKKSEIQQHLQVQGILIYNLTICVSMQEIEFYNVIHQTLQDSFYIPL